jgi:hypothetical protein
MRNFAARRLKVDSLADLAVVVHIRKAAELCPVAGNHLVVDRNCSLWLEDHSLAALLHYILAAERRLAVHTGLVDQECMQILVGLGSLSQDFDQYIEQDNLAEKVAEDNLVDLYTAADLVRLEALSVKRLKCPIIIYTVRNVMTIFQIKSI